MDETTVKPYIVVLRGDSWTRDHYISIEGHEDGQMRYIYHSNSRDGFIRNPDVEFLPKVALRMIAALGVEA